AAGDRRRRDVRRWWWSCHCGIGGLRRGVGGAASGCSVAIGRSGRVRVVDAVWLGRAARSRGGGDRMAVAAQGVALQPLVFEAGRFVAPGAVDLGQGLTLLGAAGDRRWCDVRRWWWSSNFRIGGIQRGLLRVDSGCTEGIGGTRGVCVLVPI